MAVNTEQQEQYKIKSALQLEVQPNKVIEQVAEVFLVVCDGLRTATPR